MKVLLLEGIHEIAVEKLTEAGFSVSRELTAFSDKELIEKTSNFDAIGIRSKTQLNPSFFENNKNIKAVGCFCIGTNQVHTDFANQMAVPVFNAPYSNTRSVAELVISLLVSLSRQICDRSQKAHAGVWDKSALGSNEVRGKTLGIIGYGHIGTQLSILAEALGLNVQYYDVIKKLPLGNANSISDLSQLLQTSDFVSLHVPETEQTKNMMGVKELSLMKKGSYLINASRGSVVDISALAQLIKSQHIAGAAVDVYPKEPKNNKEAFESELRGLKNVILTPHIGGSTEEAQYNIGIEVATSLQQYLLQGQSAGAVNFPQIEVPAVKDCARLLNIHKNVPGVLGEVNGIVSKFGANILRQFLSTDPNLGYLIMDLDVKDMESLQQEVAQLNTSLRTRVI